MLVNKTRLPTWWGWLGWAFGIRLCFRGFRSFAVVLSEHRDGRENENRTELVSDT
jgi:hypothetical protein